MSPLSEYDFETNFEKHESDGFFSEHELPGSLRETFSNILSYQFEPEKEENAAETLCLLLRQKFWSARRTSRHPAFMATARLLVTRVSLIYLVEEFLFLFLV